MIVYMDQEMFYSTSQSIKNRCHNLIINSPHLSTLQIKEMLITGYALYKSLQLQKRFQYFELKGYCNRMQQF